MQKIKLAVFKNMIDAGLSKYEVLFLTTIARYQDQHGLVLGVYYKDVCKELGRVSGKSKISNQKFYDCVKSLESKGLIQVEKGFKDRNIRIIANDFSDGSYREGYISVSHVIFQMKKFGQLKANEMLLCMEFLKNCEAGKRGDMNIGVEKFYDKYAAMLSVTKRVLQGYLTQIREFFSIYIKDKTYWVEIKAGTLKKFPKKADDTLFRKNIGTSVFRRFRMKYNDKTFDDAIYLMYQYGARAKGHITEMFVQAVNKSLTLVNENISNPYKWNRELKPKLVHTELKKILSSLEIMG